MPRKRPKKITLEKAFVIFDTNIAYSENLEHIVNKKFESFLSDSELKSKNKIYIPNVVMQELIHQRYAECQKKIGEIDNRLLSIQKFVGKKYKCPAKKDTIPYLAKRKIEKWFNKNRIKIIKTPYQKIDITEIESWSLSHKAPFKKATDEGIKDYLIYKTIVNFCNTQSKIRKCVLLCNDSRLQDAFKEYTENNPNVELYESLDEYLNIINLKYDHYSDEFIKSVNRTASKKFWDFKTRSGLYNKFDVWKKIESEYANELSDPTMYSDIILQGEYKPTGNRKIILSSPTYLSKSERWHNFVTDLSITRSFMHKDGFYSVNTVLIFSIFWSAKLTINGRFLDNKFESLKLSSSSATPTLDGLQSSLKKMKNSPLLDKLFQDINKD